jgi:hypothetical protein
VVAGKAEPGFILRENRGEIVPPPPSTMWPVSTSLQSECDWTTAPQIQLFFVLLTVVAVPYFIVRMSWRLRRFRRGRSDDRRMTPETIEQTDKRALQRVNFWENDRTGSEPSTAGNRLPFGCCGIRRQISHPEISDLPA